MDSHPVWSLLPPRLLAQVLDTAACRDVGIVRWFVSRVLPHQSGPAVVRQLLETCCSMVSADAHTADSSATSRCACLLVQPGAVPVPRRRMFGMLSTAHAGRTAPWRFGDIVASDVAVEPRGFLPQLLFDLADALNIASPSVDDTFEAVCQWLTDPRHNAGVRRMTPDSAQTLMQCIAHGHMPATVHCCPQAYYEIADTPVPWLLRDARSVSAHVLRVNCMHELCETCYTTDAVEYARALACSIPRIIHHCNVSRVPPHVLDAFVRAARVFHDAVATTAGRRETTVYTYRQSVMCLVLGGRRCGARLPPELWCLISQDYLGGTRGDV